MMKFFGPASQMGLARCSTGFTTNYRSVFIISIGMTVICESEKIEKQTLMLNIKRKKKRIQVIRFVKRNTFEMFHRYNKHISRTL